MAHLKFTTATDFKALIDTVAKMDLHERLAWPHHLPAHVNYVMVMHSYEFFSRLCTRPVSTDEFIRYVKWQADKLQGKKNEASTEERHARRH